MDVFEATISQRAIRSFDGRSIEPGLLERIVRAGRRAPSSMNQQRWAFVVCREREHLEQLSRVGDYAEHLAGAGAAIALVTPNVDEDWRRESTAFDLGQCAQNMTLAAWELGIGSVHAAVYDEDLVRQLLGYPEGYRCDYLLSFGYPAGGSLPGPRESGRKPLRALVHEERWGAER